LTGAREKGILFATRLKQVADSTVPIAPVDERTDTPAQEPARPEGLPPAKDRSQPATVLPYRDLNDRLLMDLIDAVKGVLRKETADRLRDVYLIGDIEKDIARGVIERLRELANDNRKPITLYINSAGGNVTDGLAIHDSIRQLVRHGIQVTTIVQGMAYSMGSVVLQAASDGRRLALPHSWIMIHEPAKWAGWQSTTAAAQHLDRLKQMQGQIYEILAKRSGRPLAKIIRDTKRTDFYLDAKKALEYGLIDAIVEE
jgi:ATP-dependent Clp protease, protease subunit